MQIIFHTWRPLISCPRLTQTGAAGAQAARDILLFFSQRTKSRGGHSGFRSALKAGGRRVFPIWLCLSQGIRGEARKLNGPNFGEPTSHSSAPGGGHNSSHPVARTRRCKTHSIRCLTWPQWPPSANGALLWRSARRGGREGTNQFKAPQSHCEVPSFGPADSHTTRAIRKFGLANGQLCAKKHFYCARPGASYAAIIAPTCHPTPQKFLRQPNPKRHLVAGTRNSTSGSLYCISEFAPEALENLLWTNPSECDPLPGLDPKCDMADSSEVRGNSGCAFVEI